jgi:hypothetical protein
VSGRARVYILDRLSCQDQFACLYGLACLDRFLCMLLPHRRACVFVYCGVVFFFFFYMARLRLACLYVVVCASDLIACLCAVHVEFFSWVF